jgi:TRAP-type C4-dicarboxylate transport system permease small subunit
MARRHLIRLLEVTVSGGVYAMTGVLVLQVFCRYALDASLSWSEELSRYLMIWIAMLGAVAVLDSTDFVSFRWIVNLLGPTARRVVRVLTVLSSIAFLAIMVYVGTKLALHNMKQLSPALYMPIGWVYAALPVGSLLIAVRLVPRMSGDETRTRDADPTI